MNKLLDILVGFTMIFLSLFCQLIVFTPMSFIPFAILDVFDIPADGPEVQIIIYLSYALLFNGIACYTYFKKKTVVTLGTPGLRPAIHAFKAIAAPDSAHISFVIYLVPRGIDRIFYGKEYIGELDEGTEPKA